MSPNRERIPDPLLPVGAATVAALLRDLGHEVRLLDLCHEPEPAAAVRRHLADWPPDLIGLSIRNLENNQLLGHRSYLDDLRALVSTIRGVSAAPIVGGGAGFSLFPAEMLEVLGLDYGLAGEAEVSLGALVEAIVSRRPPGGIPGACYRDGGRVVVAGPARVRSFERVTLPAYDLLDCRAYVQQGAAIPVESKRGCDLDCSFCAEGAHAGGTVLKPVAALVDEIEALVGVVGTNRLHFTDGVFHHPAAHAEAVCAEIVRRGLVVRWRCGVNPVGLRRTLLERMREAGCRFAALGLDAVTGDMLRRYRKGFRVADIQASLSALREVGLPFTVHVLFGGPGETEASVMAALDVLEDLAPDEPTFFAFGLRVFQGTQLERTAASPARLLPRGPLAGTTYYLAEGLDDGVAARIKERCARHPRWFSPPYEPTD